LTAEPGQLPLDDLLQSILLLMGMMGVLALFLSCFLIVNTVTAQLAQQRRQIGVMKAVGASSSQVMWLYLLAVLIYGAAALGVAVPVSQWAAQALSQYLAGLFNFDLAQVEPPAWTFWLQVVVGIVTPVLAALWPLVGSVRISAAEAMSAFGGVRVVTVVDEFLHRVAAVFRAAKDVQKHPVTDGEGADERLRRRLSQALVRFLVPDNRALFRLSAVEFAGLLWVLGDLLFDLAVLDHVLGCLRDHVADIIEAAPPRPARDLVKVPHR